MAQQRLVLHVPQAVPQGHGLLRAGQLPDAARLHLPAAGQGLPAAGQLPERPQGVPGGDGVLPREPGAADHHRADLPAPGREPARLRLPREQPDARPPKRQDHPRGGLHHPGQPGHGRGAGEVPRGGRAEPEQRAALEQHRHVLLREGAVRGQRGLPEARALPGPLRVDRLLQPGTSAPEHGAVRLRLPLLLLQHQPQAGLRGVVHVPGHHAGPAGRLRERLRGLRQGRGDRDGLPHPPQLRHHSVRQ
mmetsp:Transcript_24956/g.43638  ORF Transcript_24956/g.43638 Transcript_24956/m.43638 type:complete len:248 (+) Transcript_24956:529-1272(+)